LFKYGAQKGTVLFISYKTNELFEFDISEIKRKTIIITFTNYIEGVSEEDFK
jgi:hypothetical protein